MQFVNDMPCRAKRSRFGMCASLKGSPGIEQARCSSLNTYSRLGLRGCGAAAAEAEANARNSRRVGFMPTPPSNVRSASPGVNCLLNPTLKTQSHRELHLARRADRPARLAEIGIAQRNVGIGERGRVGEVECLPAELQSETFRQADILHQTGIEVEQPVGVQNRAAGVAEAV